VARNRLEQARVENRTPYGQRSSRRCCADAFLEGSAIRDGLLRPATPIDHALAEQPVV